MHSYQHKDSYGPGIRFGGLFGGRAADWLSLNAELTVDHSNINESSSISQQWYFRVSLSPLVHLRAGAVELGFGPKLGFYSVSSNYSASGASVDMTDSGYSTGVNAGAFVSLSREMAVGLLLSFDVMWSQQYCAIISFPTTVPGKCGPTTDVGEVLGLAAGLLF